MRFNLFKYLCILIFITSLVLFTLGYTNQPILNLTTKATLNLPTVPNVTSNTPMFELPNNGNFKVLAYLNKMVNTTDNTTINYSELNTTLGTVITYMNYIFIGISVCIGLVILLSFIGLKTISYIPLLIALIAMIIICIIIFALYSSGYLNNILTQYVNNQSPYLSISNTKVNYDNGGIFITLSTGLLFANYFLYIMLG